MNPSTETSGKPADIPHDVWEAAMRVAVEMEIHAALSTRTDAKGEIIARAMLAAKAEEREACAQITVQYSHINGQRTDRDGRGMIVDNVCAAIAAEIRNRGEG